MKYTPSAIFATEPSPTASVRSVVANVDSDLIVDKEYFTS